MSDPDVQAAGMRSVNLLCYRCAHTMSSFDNVTATASVVASSCDGKGSVLGYLTCFELPGAVLTRCSAAANSELAARARAALAAVHECGVCHGDIRSDNVLVVDAAQVCRY